MAKETQIKLTKTRYRLGCLGVTFILRIHWVAFFWLYFDPDQAATERCIKAA